MSKVSELIYDGKWNAEILSSMFTTEDCRRIKNISLSIMGCKDRLVWPYSATGEYCAKTGYMLAREMQKEKMKVQQKRRSVVKEVVMLEFGNSSRI